MLHINPLELTNTVERDDNNLNYTYEAKKLFNALMATYNQVLTKPFSMEQEDLEKEINGLTEKFKNSTDGGIAAALKVSVKRIDYIKKLSESRGNLSALINLFDHGPASLRELFTTHHSLHAAALTHTYYQQQIASWIKTIQIEEMALHQTKKQSITDKRSKEYSKMREHWLVIQSIYRGKDQQSTTFENFNEGIRTAFGLPSKQGSETSQGEQELYRAYQTVFNGKANITSQLKDWWNKIAQNPGRTKVFRDVRKKCLESFVKRAVSHFIESEKAYLEQPSDARKLILERRASELISVMTLADRRQKGMGLPRGIPEEWLGGDKKKLAERADAVFKQEDPTLSDVTRFTIESDFQATVSDPSFAKQKEQEKVFYQRYLDACEKASPAELPKARLSLIYACQLLAAPYQQEINYYQTLLDEKEENHLKPYKRNETVYAEQKENLVQKRKDQHAQLVDQALDVYLAETSQVKRIRAVLRFNALRTLYQQQYQAYKNEKLTLEIAKEMQEALQVKALDKVKLVNLINDRDRDRDLLVQRPKEITPHRELLFEVNKEWSEVIVGKIPTKIESTYHVVMGDDFTEQYRQDLIFNKYYQPFFDDYEKKYQKMKSDFFANEAKRKACQASAAILLYRVHNVCSLFYPQWYAGNKSVFDNIEAQFPSLTEENNYGLTGKILIDEKQIQGQIIDRFSLLNQKLTEFRETKAKHSPLSAKELHHLAVSLTIAITLLNKVVKEEENKDKAIDAKREELQAKARLLIDVILESISHMYESSDPLSELSITLHKSLSYIDHGGVKQIAYPDPSNVFKDNLTQKNKSSLVTDLNQAADAVDMSAFPDTPLEVFVNFILRYGSVTQQQTLSNYFQLEKQAIPLTYIQQGNFYTPYLPGFDLSQLPTEGIASQELQSVMQQLSAIFIKLNLLAEKPERLKTLLRNPSHITSDDINDLATLSAQILEIEALGGEALRKLDEIQGRTNLPSYLSKNRDIVIAWREQLLEVIPQGIEKLKSHWLSFKDAIYDFAQHYDGSSQKIHHGFLNALKQMDLFTDDHPEHPLATIAYKRSQFLYDYQVPIENPKENPDVKLIEAHEKNQTFIKQIRKFLEDKIDTNDFDELFVRIPDPVQREQYINLAIAYDTDARRVKLINAFAEQYLIKANFTKQATGNIVAKLNAVKNIEDEISFRQAIESKFLYQLSRAKTKEEERAYFEICQRYGSADCRTDAALARINNHLLTDSLETLQNDLTYYFTHIVKNEDKNLIEKKLQKWLIIELGRSPIDNEKQQKLDYLITRYGNDDEKVKLFGRKISEIFTNTNEIIINNASGAILLLERIDALYSEMKENVTSEDLLKTLLTDWIADKLNLRGDDLLLSRTHPLFPSISQLVMKYGKDEQKAEVIKVLFVALEGQEAERAQVYQEIEKLNNKAQEDLHAWLITHQNLEKEFSELCYRIQYQQDTVLSYVREHNTALREALRNNHKLKLLKLREALEQHPDVALRTYRGIVNTNWRPLAQEVYELLNLSEFRNDEYTNWLTAMITYPESIAECEEKDPLTEKNAKEFNKKIATLDNPTHAEIAKIYDEKNAVLIKKATHAYINNYSFTTYASQFANVISNAVKSLISGIATFVSKIAHSLFERKTVTLLSPQAEVITPKEPASEKPSRALERFHQRQQLVDELHAKKVENASKKLREGIAQYHALPKYKTLFENQKFQKWDGTHTHEIPVFVGSRFTPYTEEHEVISSTQKQKENTQNEVQKDKGKEKETRANIQNEVKKEQGRIEQVSVEVQDPTPLTDEEREEIKCLGIVRDNEEQVVEYVRRACFSKASIEKADWEELSQLVGEGVPFILKEDGKSIAPSLLARQLFELMENQENFYQLYQNLATHLAVLADHNETSNENWLWIANYGIENLKTLYLHLDSERKLKLTSQLDKVMTKIPADASSQIKNRLALMGNILDPNPPVSLRKVEYTYVAKHFDAYHQLEKAVMVDTFSHALRTFIETQGELSQKFAAMFKVYDIPSTLDIEQGLAAFIAKMKVQKVVLADKKSTFYPLIDQLFPFEVLPLMQGLNEAGLTSPYQSLEYQSRLEANQKADQLLELLSNKDKWEAAAAEPQSLDILIDSLYKVNRFADSVHRALLRKAIEREFDGVITHLRNYLLSQKASETVLQTSYLKFLQNLYHGIYQEESKSSEADVIAEKIDKAVMDVLGSIRIHLSSQGDWLKRDGVICDKNDGSGKSGVVKDNEWYEKFVASARHFINVVGSEGDKREMDWRATELPVLCYLHEAKNTRVSEVAKDIDEVSNEVVCENKLCGISESYFSRQEKLATYFEDKKTLSLLDNFATKRFSDAKQFVQVATKAWMTHPIAAETRFLFTTRVRDPFSCQLLKYSQYSMVESVYKKIDDIVNMRNELIKHGIDFINDAARQKILSKEAIIINNTLCRDNYAVRTAIKIAAQQTNITRDLAATDDPKKHLVILEKGRQKFEKHQALLILSTKIGKLDRLAQWIDEKKKEDYNYQLLAYSEEFKDIKAQIIALKQAVAGIKPDKKLKMDKILQSKDLRDQIAKVDEASNLLTEKFESLIENSSKLKVNLNKQWVEINNDMVSPENMLAEIKEQEERLIRYLAFSQENNTQENQQQNIITFKASTAISQGGNDPIATVETLEKIIEVTQDIPNEEPLCIKPLAEKELSVDTLRSSIINFSPAFFTVLMNLMEKLVTGTLTTQELDKLPALILEGETPYFVVTEQQKQRLTNFIHDHADALQSEEAKSLLVFAEKAMVFDELLNTPKDKLADKGIKEDEIKEVNKKFALSRASLRVFSALEEFIKDPEKHTLHTLTNGETLLTIKEMTPLQHDALEHKWDELLAKLWDEKPDLQALAVQNLLDAIPYFGGDVEQKKERLEDVLRSLASDYAIQYENHFQKLNKDGVPFTLNAYLDEIDKMVNEGKYKVLTQYGSDEDKNRVFSVIKAGAEPYKKVAEIIMNDPEQPLEKLLETVNQEDKPILDESERWKGYEVADSLPFFPVDEEEIENGADENQIPLKTSVEKVEEQNKKIKITPAFFECDEADLTKTLESLKLNSLTMVDKLRVFNRMTRQNISKLRQPLWEKEKERLLELESWLKEMDQRTSGKAFLSKIRHTVMDLMLNADSFIRLRLAELLLNYNDKTKELKDKLATHELQLKNQELQRTELVKQKAEMEKHIYGADNADSLIPVMNEVFVVIDQEIKAIDIKIEVNNGRISEFYQTIERRKGMQATITSLFPAATDLSRFYIDACLEPDRVRRTHQEAIQFSLEFLTLKEKTEEKVKTLQEIKNLLQSLQDNNNPEKIGTELEMMKGMLAKLQSRDDEKDFLKRMKELNTFLEVAKLQASVDTLFTSIPEGENKDRIKTLSQEIEIQLKNLGELVTHNQQDQREARDRRVQISRQIEGGYAALTYLAPEYKAKFYQLQQKKAVLIRVKAELNGHIANCETKLHQGLEANYKEMLMSHCRRLAKEIAAYYQTKQIDVNRLQNQLTCIAREYGNYLQEAVSLFKLQAQTNKEKADFIVNIERKINDEIQQRLQSKNPDDAKSISLEKEARLNYAIAKELKLYDRFGWTLISVGLNGAGMAKMMQMQQNAEKGLAIPSSPEKGVEEVTETVHRTLAATFAATFKYIVYRIDNLPDTVTEKQPLIVGSFLPPELELPDGTKVAMDDELFATTLVASDKQKCKAKENIKDNVKGFKENLLLNEKRKSMPELLRKKQGEEQQNSEMQEPERRMVKTCGK